MTNRWLHHPTRMSEFIHRQHEWLYVAIAINKDLRKATTLTAIFRSASDICFSKVLAFNCPALGASGGA